MPVGQCRRRASGGPIGSLLAGSGPRRPSADDAEVLGQPGQDLAARLGDDDKVFDPNAKLSGQVDARFDGDDVAGDKSVLGSLGEPRGLMDLDPDAVTEPVAVVVPVTGVL